MKKRTTKKQKPQTPEAAEPMKKTEADSNQGKTTDVPFDGRTITFRFKGGQSFSFERED